MDSGPTGPRGAIVALHVATEPGLAEGAAGVLPTAVPGAAAGGVRRKLATISEAVVRWMVSTAFSCCKK